MKWVRWLPGKWHALEAPVPAWAELRYGPTAVATMCGRYMREPDRLTDRPLTERCPTCVRAMSGQGLPA